MNTLIRFTLTALLVLLATSFTHAGDKITYYHNDALGSPVAATNQLGQVIWRETYKPHGQRTTNAAASINNKVWFTGKQEESALGINYFGARWYHPEVGRFLVIDPVGVSPDNIHSFNRYGYANQNPYGFVDPDGRDSQEAEWAALGQSPPSAQMVRAAANVAQAGKTVADVGDAVMPHSVVEAAVPFGAFKLGKWLKKLHGNVVDDRPATLYKKLDKDGNFEKWGVTKHEDPTKRYTLKEIDGGTVREVERGSRREMLKKERDLVETQPGPKNRERWAGSRKKND